MLKMESVTMSHHHIFATIALAGALLIAPGRNVGAVPISPSLSHANGLSAIELVQDKPKSETVQQKVKRIWRNLTAYKFDVACPAFTFAITRANCSVNGKNREDARAKCQSQYVLCEIRDANR
jgi:hypothetical protein